MMLIYTLRRFLSMAPILLGVTVVLFLTLAVIPGEPALFLTGAKMPSEQTMANLNERLEIDKPLHQQYLDYVQALIKGDFGRSYRSQRPVGEIISEAAPRSFSLASWVVLLELLISLPVGVLSAVKRGSLMDKSTIAWYVLLLATPVFLLALLGQLVFGVWLGWLPVAGLGGAAHYILPVSVLGLLASAYLTPVVRSNVIEVLSQDHIIAARANGLPEYRIVWRHALKNALPPVITVAALHFGFVIGSAVATEVVFNWPGLGMSLYKAVLGRDRPVVAGITLVVASAFLLVNFVVDLMHAWLDPRVRFFGEGGTLND